MTDAQMKELADKVAEKLGSRKCPHGMSSEDIHQLREFLRWWDDTKSTAWRVMVRVIVCALLGSLGFGLLYKWFPGGKSL